MNQTRTAVLALLSTAAMMAGVGFVIAEFQRPALNEPQYYRAAPISEELSAEAHRGCIDLGMTETEIAERQEECLRAYWTIERLKKSTRVQTDWYADQGYRIANCAPGYIRPRWTFFIDCETVGYDLEDDRRHKWLLPTDEDWWWRDQPTRDPGRVTEPQHR